MYLCGSNQVNDIIYNIIIILYKFCYSHPSHTPVHTHTMCTAGDLDGADLSSLRGRLPLSQRLHSLHLLLVRWLCQLEESTKGQ